MTMQDNSGAIDTSESWTPPDEQQAATSGDESQGIDTSTAPSAQQPSYANPPPGNAIQSGNQAAGGFLASTFGNQGAIPNTGSGETPPDQSPQAGGQQGTDLLQKLLHGEGAVTPDVLDHVVQKSPGATNADKLVTAIHQAGDKGPDAQAAILQAARVKYSTSAAFAFTALQGTAQKPADLNAAIKAANTAQEYLPDGSNVLFSPGGQGMVIAVASMPGTTKTTQFNLSTQQFGQFLDVGKDGQFDKMMDTSAPAMLQRLASANAGGGAAQPSNTGDNSGPSQQGLDTVKQQDADKAAGVTPGMSDEDATTQRESSAQENKWKQQAMDQFPWASQGKQRGETIAAQRDQAQKQANAIEVAGETGKAKRAVAEVQAGGKVKAAEVTADSKERGWKYATDAKRQNAMDALSRAQLAEQGKDRRSALGNQIGLLKKKIEVGTPLTEEDNALAKKYGVAADQAMSGAPQAPTPQAPNPNQAQADNAGKKLYNGQWYTREEYQKAFGK